MDNNFAGFGNTAALRDTARLGVDIGRVIIDGTHHPDGDDTTFFTGDTARLLRTPAMADVFEVLPDLVARFGGRVWLVSKCGVRVEQRTRMWLAHHDFAGRTGIPPGNLRFCRRRPDKAVHCAELGITHFIDDRPDVHEALAGVVAYRYLFGPQTGPSPRGVRATMTWQDVRRAFDAPADAPADAPVDAPAQINGGSATARCGVSSQVR